MMNTIMSEDHVEQVDVATVVVDVTKKKCIDIVHRHSQVRFLAWKRNTCYPEWVVFILYICQNNSHHHRKSWNPLSKSIQSDKKQSSALLRNYFATLILWRSSRQKYKISEILCKKKSSQQISIIYSDMRMISRKCILRHMLVLIDLWILYKHSSKLPDIYTL